MDWSYFLKDLQFWTQEEIDEARREAERMMKILGWD